MTPAVTQPPEQRQRHFPPPKQRPKFGTERKPSSGGAARNRYDLRRNPDRVARQVDEGTSRQQLSFKLQQLFYARSDALVLTGVWAFLGALLGGLIGLGHFEAFWPGLALGGLGAGAWGYRKAYRKG